MLLPSDAARVCMLYMCTASFAGAKGAAAPFRFHAQQGGGRPPPNDLAGNMPCTTMHALMWLSIVLMAVAAMLGLAASNPAVPSPPTDSPRYVTGNVKNYSELRQTVIGKCFTH